MLRAAFSLTLLLTGLVAAPVHADLQCRAEVDRVRVTAGGNLILTLHAEARVQDQPRHEPPHIEGVLVQSGGTSQSFSFGTGGTQVAVSSTYHLVVQRSDDFTIPAIQFTAAGRTCATEPITIAVDPPAGASPASPPAAGPGPLAGQRGDPVFITLEVDQAEVWLGQQIILTFRYHRQRHARLQPSYTPPRTEGFWRLDLPPERNYRLSFAGVQYDVTEIRYALFPTRTGALTIDPARLEMQSDPFDRFFGRRPRIPQRLETSAVTVQVRPLPLPRPEEFSGIVAGNLGLIAKVSRDTIPRGEPVSLVVEVSADAFLKSFTGLRVPELDGLRLHDGAESLREDTSGPRYQAMFRQDMAVVPLSEGELELPPVELTFFDTGAGRYRTVRAPTPPLVVTASDLPVVGDDPSGFRRTEIARLGRDLAFVHAARGSLRRALPPLVHQPLWWAVLAAPWGLLGLYRLRLRREAAARRDPLGQRRRLAWPRAQQELRRLAAGKGEVGDLVRTVQGYVADCSGRQPAGLTTQEIQTWCEGLGHAATGKRLADILIACDRARFGGVGEVDVATGAAEVSKLLIDLQQADRSRVKNEAGRLASWTFLLVLASALSSGGDAATQDLQPPRGPAPGVDPARLLAEGNQAYTEGDLETALDRYRVALRQGRDAPELHYNLGNVHARRGELGRAIASYLRAQRLAPRDRDLQTNLAWVRSHTRDLELIGEGLPPLIAQLDAAVHLLSLDELAMLLLLFSWLTVLAVAWTWRRGWLSPAWRRWRLLLATVLLLVCVVTATRWYEEQQRDLAVIIAAEVAVRSGPATTFPEVFRVHDGLTLEVRGERDGWARIGLGGDWVGWVPAGTLERVRQPVAAYDSGR